MVGTGADVLLMKQKQLPRPDNLNEIVLQESENEVVKQLAKRYYLFPSKTTATLEVKCKNKKHTK